VSTEQFELDRARIALKQARKRLRTVHRQIQTAERANQRSRPPDRQHLPGVAPAALVLEHEAAAAEVERWEGTMAFLEGRLRSGTSAAFASFGGLNRIMAQQAWGPGPYPDRAYPGEQRQDWDEGDAPGSSRPKWWPR